MKKLTLTLFLSKIILLLFAQPPAEQNQSVVLQDVQYLDFETGAFKKGSLLLSNGKIENIGASFMTDGSIRIIKGNGKWVIPGLVDAHIHMFQSGGIYTRPDAINLTKYRDYPTEINWLKENAGDLLKRYLRCGITTVIDVGGPMHNYVLRDQFDVPDQYPNMYVTGPLISTYQPAAFNIEDAPIIKVHNKEEAIAQVQKQIPFKPDFIKIWYINLPDLPAEETYGIVEATIKESHDNGLKVAVHATELSTAKLALKAGADILVHSVDDPIDEAFIHSLKKSNAIYIPTLIVHGKYTEVFSQQLNLSKEDFLYSNPMVLGSLFDPRHYEKGNPLEQFLPYVKQMAESTAMANKTRGENLKLLQENGIVISTGTDAGNIGTLHATSYYEEIGYMKAAGLSNLEILKASTINGAKVLGKEDEFGSIEINKMADLLVLNSNPLEDIDALKDMQYVIKGGFVHEVDEIVIESPEYLVQQQLNAYNARDIDAFLAPYSDDIEIYDHPDRLTAKGKDVIRPQYASMFENVPDLHCELVNRIVLGNTVIDQERVTGFPNMEVLEAIAVYTIENNKIAKVRFISK